MYFVESLPGTFKWERTFDRFFSLSRPYVDFVLETKVTTTRDVLNTRGNFKRWLRHIRPRCDPFLSGASSVSISLNNSTVTVGEDFRVVDTHTTDQPYALSELDGTDFFEEPGPSNVTRNDGVMRADYAVKVYGREILPGGVTGTEVEVTESQLLMVVTLVSAGNNSLGAHDYEVYRGDDFTNVYGYIRAGSGEVTGTPALFVVQPTAAGGDPLYTTDELTVESGNHAVNYAVHTAPGFNLGGTLTSTSLYQKPPSIEYRFVHHIYQELHHPLSKEWRDLFYFSCDAPFVPGNAVEVYPLTDDVHTTTVTGRPRIAWYPSCALSSHEVQTLQTVDAPVVPGRCVSPVVTLTQTPSRIFVYVKAEGYGAIKFLRLRTSQYTQYDEYDREALYRETVKNGSKQDRNGFLKGGPVILTMGPVQLARVQMQVEVTFEGTEQGYRLYVTCEGVETLTLEDDGRKKRLLPDSE